MEFRHEEGSIEYLMGQGPSRSASASQSQPVQDWKSNKVTAGEARESNGSGRRESRNTSSRGGSAYPIVFPQTTSVDLAPMYSFLQAASSLMHAMQAERGASTVLCSSKGGQFKSNLQLLRAVTDESWERLSQARLYLSCIRVFCLVRVVALLLLL